MIEIKVASLANEPGKGEFWQGLNAASVAVQQVAQSETAVFEVFCEQLVNLGLHGSINLLDETGTTLNVVSIAFSERLMRFIRQTERVTHINALKFSYPADASLADQTVLQKGDVVFLTDNSEKMRQIIPPHIYRFSKTLLKPFLKIPAVLVPIFIEKNVAGVLYVAGKDLRQADVPAIAAFGTHLSIALEKARLFQAVKEAESHYRLLFESANDAIFVLDPETRQLLSANPKMLALLDMRADELEHIRPSAWAPSDIYEMYQFHFGQTLKNGHHFFEVPFFSRNGDQHHWQISTTVIEVNGKPVINGMVRDITEANAAEKALRQREEQLRVLAENVPGTIYLCKNEPNFPLLFINDGIEALTGLAKNKFLQQEVLFADLVHPDDQPPFHDMTLEAILTRRASFHYIYRLRHQSGAWRWVEDVGGGVFDEDGGLAFLEGVITDITERVQSELVQKTVFRIASVAHTELSSDALYRTIHESLSPLLDVQKFYLALYDEASGQISVPYYVDNHQQEADLFEMTRGLTEYVVRLNDSQLLTEEQLKFYARQGIIRLPGLIPHVWLGVPLRSQGQAIGALMVQSYDNQSTFSEQDKQILTFVAEQIGSVIARKQAEEQQNKLSVELTQQTRLLEAILTATPDNFLVFDIDGRFLFVSEEILDHLQVTADQVVGKTWQELKLPSDFGNNSDKDRQRVLQTGGPVSRELHYPMVDGLREIEFITSPVVDQNGQITSFVTTTRDITEHKQTLQAMHRVQKMESLGLLAGGIAHDFNNLLVAMMGQASLAQNYLPQNHPAFIHVRKAVQAAEQAAGLTRQLLAYSGGGQFSVKPLDLNAFINRNIDLLKVALPKQVPLELELSPELPLVEVDPAQIQQVVMNLLINAAEAIGDQVGSIRVQTAVRQITKEDHLYWRYTNYQMAPGLYVSLQIRDSGRGMEKEMISRIFDPFFTTKFTGRGLGLAAVLGIVRSHHGGLRVTSQADQGTEFELLFPISEETAVAEIPEIGSVSPQSGVVLVIDDEAPVRDAVTDILDLEGIRVLSAANGNEGLALYKKQADQIDLILLDLSMPGKSGSETFAELEAFDPAVRIVLSSGYSEADATQGFKSPPLIGFIQKPYHLEHFVNRIQQYLQEAAHHKKNGE